jgi:hypothetical protein
VIAERTNVGAKEVGKAPEHGGAFVSCPALDRSFEIVD